MPRTRKSACTRRNRSNTPLQALHLANDPVFVEIAKGLGDRILKEGPADDAGRIAFGFELCFARALRVPANATFAGAVFCTTETGERGASVDDAGAVAFEFG